MSTGKVSPASGMEMETIWERHRVLLLYRSCQFSRHFICTNVIYAEDSTSNIITTILLVKYKFQEIHLYLHSWVWDLSVPLISWWCFEIQRKEPVGKSFPFSPKA
jgi:hypothetical protein